MNGARYTFQPVTLPDLPLLTAWRDLSHVARWWDAGPLFDADDLTDPRLSLNLVSCDGAPFAYQQTYSVKGWDFQHHFGAFPDGARGIDQFIGPPEFLGKGHGPRFIKAALARLFADGAPAVVTDPHPDNKRAIRAYEKAGLHAHGPVMETKWGRILPMSIWAP
ncbi:GNAT family N-acetyltransferase [Gymnodinialimonas ulvae]|uniref:GNAT family N-acetyltransferase n=1 Tax=Gymnodinialimonas ulvae TaxID=3126504 RepID=UPI00309FBEC8